MNKLSFKQVTNIIGNDYFVCPKDENAWERVIFKTTKLGAFLLTLLQQELTIHEMVELAKKEFKQETEQNITNTAIKVKNSLSDLNLEQNKLEVIEI